MGIRLRNMDEWYYTLPTGSNVAATNVGVDDNVASVRVLRAGTITNVWGDASIGTSIVLELERSRAGTQASVGTVTATPSGVAMSSLSNTDVVEGDILVMHTNSLTGNVVGCSLTVKVDHKMNK